MEKKTLEKDLASMSTKEIGFLAEGIARHYLIKKDYKILAANYKMSFGEIDIIAQKDSTVIFAEVKANKDVAPEFSPEIRVDYKKKNKLINLATAYMLNREMADLDWQIDIISVIFDSENKKAHIKHFKNAVNSY
ncbi:MAG: YraN family protein [Patescibacteria group bacterium]